MIRHIIVPSNLGSLIGVTSIAGVVVSFTVSLKHVRSKVSGILLPFRLSKSFIQWSKRDNSVGDFDSD